MPSRNERALDYEKANYSLQGRNQDRRKVENNTYLERRDGGDIAVRLHGTDVVTYHKNGSMTFDTGGFYSVTTKDRMNKYSPFRFYSVKGRWYVSADGEGVPYVNGMTLTPGESLPITDTSAEEAQNAQTRKAVTKYVKGLTDEKIAELAAQADTGEYKGDCMFCLFDMTGTEHFESHIEEGYYMLSLCVRALEAKGYRFPMVIMAAHPAMVRQAVKRYMLRALVVGPVAVS